MLKQMLISIKKVETAKREIGKHLMKRAGKPVSLWLLLALSWWLSAAQAQQSPTPAPQLQSPLVETVDAVGLTVADMDRSLEFYTKGLNFEPVKDS